MDDLVIRLRAIADMGDAQKARAALGEVAAELDRVRGRGGEAGEAMRRTAAATEQTARAAKAQVMQNFAVALGQAGERARALGAALDETNPGMARLAEKAATAAETTGRMLGSVAAGAAVGGLPGAAAGAVAGFGGEVINFIQGWAEARAEVARIEREFQSTVRAGMAAAREQARASDEMLDAARRSSAAEQALTASLREQSAELRALGEAAGARLAYLAEEEEHLVRIARLTAEKTGADAAAAEAAVRASAAAGRERTLAGQAAAAQAAADRAAAQRDALAGLGDGLLPAAERKALEGMQAAAQKEMLAIRTALASGTAGMPMDTRRYLGERDWTAQRTNTYAQERLEASQGAANRTGFGSLEDLQGELARFDKLVAESGRLAAEAAQGIEAETEARRRASEVQQAAAPIQGEDVRARALEQAVSRVETTVGQAVAEDATGRLQQAEGDIRRELSDVAEAARTAAGNAQAMPQMLSSMKELSTAIGAGKGVNLVLSALADEVRRQQGELAVIRSQLKAVAEMPRN